MGVRESRYNIWVELGDVAYVYNGVSGGLLALSSEDRASLTRFLAGGDSCRPELLSDLGRGGMLVSDEFDELDLLRLRYRASRASHRTFGLTIVTSLGCNFDCPYCFEAKHHSIMDADVQQAVLRVLDDQLARGVTAFGVTWYGGEPLVGRKPLLALSDAFIARCDDAGAAYSARIITNGSLLSESTCRELQQRKVTFAQITLDGPPDVHDRMRPYVSGRGSFWQIVKNLRHAPDYLQIAVRVNVDSSNFDRVEELLQILAAERLAGRIDVAPGQIVGMTSNPAAPSAEYATKSCCFSNPEYAQAEREFVSLAKLYGFARHSLPKPIGTPCTAVRANELVVGSKGELYKCWDSVGDRTEIIGHIRDYENQNGRLYKWLNYDPFANDECRGCIALPVCMGGCAHHAMEAANYANRCGTFRHTYREQVRDFVSAALESQA